MQHRVWVADPSQFVASIGATKIDNLMPGPSGLSLVVNALTRYFRHAENPSLLGKSSSVVIEPRPLRIGQGASIRAKSANDIAVADVREPHKPITPYPHDQQHRRDSHADDHAIRSFRCFIGPSTALTAE